MLNRYYSSNEVADLRLADNKIFGLPAANVAKHSGNVNNSRGAYGEEIIGNILNLIVVETPGAYVCHSVGFIDDKNGEIDHVIIYKNRVILVETKAYSGYRSYRVNKEGVLTASNGKGRYRRINDSNVFNKVAYYQEMFPNKKVQSIMAVARDDVKTWSENGRYKVASLSNIMTVIYDQFAEAEDVKEPAWAVVKQFAVMCMKPKAGTRVRDVKPVTGAVEVQTPPAKHQSAHTTTNKYSQRPAVLRH